MKTYSTHDLPNFMGIHEQSENYMVIIFSGGQIVLKDIEHLLSIGLEVCSATQGPGNDKQILCRKIFK